jgi:hypothetical protein
MGHGFPLNGMAALGGHRSGKRVEMRRPTGTAGKCVRNTLIL